METHLTYDSKGKQLGVLVKEKFTTDHNLQLKARPLVLNCWSTFDSAMAWCLTSP